MQKKIFNVPILFIIFNRPDYAQVVFNEIKKIKPKKLYIAADGPRKCNENDLINCSKTREIINQINWGCDVKTLFRQENLGCKISISSAITWFFKNELSGIILEDDCLPEQSFFWFCEELLEKYKNNKKVMMISGTSYLFNKAKFKESYFFTNFFAIWGWATWRRAWDLYDINMNGWEDYKKNQKLLKIYKDQIFTNFIESMGHGAYYNLVNTWDFQWFFSCLKNECYTIMPKFNLISNIGVSGTHSDNQTSTQFFPTKPINLRKLVHPKEVNLDYYLNSVIYKNILEGYPISKIKKILLLSIKFLKKIIKRLFKFFNLEVRRINI
jgi:GR25 family glycosyltransferase involved in LPS biosynthesis